MTQAKFAEIRTLLSKDACGLLRKEEKTQLDSNAPVFVADETEGIIRSAAGSNATEAQIKEIVDRIKDAPLDDITKSHLVLAIEDTKNMQLASAQFVELVCGMDPGTARAYLSLSIGYNGVLRIAQQDGKGLYQIGFIDDGRVLANSQLFSKDFVDFLSKLGPHSASEWLYAIFVTGNVKALTSKEATSSHVLGLIGGDTGAENAKNHNKRLIAGELAYAIGTLPGFLERLTPEYLSSLKGMGAKAHQSLSGMWNTGDVDRFTDSETLRRIAKGELDVWDLIRTNKGSATAKILIARLGVEDHNRGALLVVQMLRDSGIDVVYLDKPRSAKEIVAVAKREGVSSVGFSIMDDMVKPRDAYQRMAVETSKRIAGVGGMTVFGGGMMVQGTGTVQLLQGAGVKVFGQGSSKDDLLKFLDRSASAHSQWVVHHANAAGHAGNSFDIAYAPATASGSSWHSGTALHVSASVAGAAAVGAYLRSERGDHGASVSALVSAPHYVGQVRPDAGFAGSGFASVARSRMPDYGREEAEAYGRNNDMHSETGSGVAGQFAAPYDSQATAVRISASPPLGGIGAAGAYAFGEAAAEQASSVVIAPVRATSVARADALIATSDGRTVNVQMPTSAFTLNSEEGAHPASPFHDTGQIYAARADVLMDASYGRTALQPHASSFMFEGRAHSAPFHDQRQIPTARADALMVASDGHTANVHLPASAFTPNPEEGARSAPFHSPWKIHTARLDVLMAASDGRTVGVQPHASSFALEERAHSAPFHDPRQVRAASYASRKASGMSLSALLLMALLKKAFAPFRKQLGTSKRIGRSGGASGATSRISRRARLQFTARIV